MTTYDDNNEGFLSTNGFRLKQTCFGCPEQYDVYDSDEIRVAYLHLRNGYFYAQVGGVVVYDAYPRGDGLFDDDQERFLHLNRAVEAVQSYLVNCAQPDYSY